MKTSVRFVLAAFVLAGAMSGALTQPKPQSHAPAVMLTSFGGPVPLCDPTDPTCVNPGSIPPAAK